MPRSSTLDPAVCKPVDAATIKAMLEQHFEHAGEDPERGHEMYREDAVLEFPQSGERFEGVENFRAWRSSYPASTAFEVREVRGRDDLWVAEISISYDQGPRNFGVSILELRGDKSAGESIYISESWDPPACLQGVAALSTVPHRGLGLRVQAYEA